MLRLIRQVFIALLSFSRSLATKCVYLNNKLCITRPTFVDLNPVDLNYLAPFMIRLDKCNGSCNVVDEAKDVNVKVFNRITRVNEVKTLVEHISCDYKCKFNRTTCNSNQK